MSDLNELLNSQQVSEMLKDTKKLEQIRDAAETQKLFALLRRSTGGNLEQTTREDTAQVISAIRKLMRDPEGTRLLQSIQNKLK